MSIFQQHQQEIHQILPSPNQFSSGAFKLVRNHHSYKPQKHLVECQTLEAELDSSIQPQHFQHPIPHHDPNIVHFGTKKNSEDITAPSSIRSTTVEPACSSSPSATIRFNSSDQPRFTKSRDSSSYNHTLECLATDSIKKENKRDHLTLTRQSLGMSADNINASNNQQYLSNHNHQHHHNMFNNTFNQTSSTSSPMHGSNVTPNNHPSSMQQYSNFNHMDSFTSSTPNNYENSTCNMSSQYSSSCGTTTSCDHQANNSNRHNQPFHYNLPQLAHHNQDTLANQETQPNNQSFPVDLNVKNRANRSNSSSSCSPRKPTFGMSNSYHHLPQQQHVGGGNNHGGNNGNGARNQFSNNMYNASPPSCMNLQVGGPCNINNNRCNDVVPTSCMNGPTHALMNQTKDYKMPTTTFSIQQEKIKKPRKTIKRRYQFKNQASKSSSPSSPSSSQTHSNESRKSSIETVSYYATTDGKELDLTGYYHHQLQYTTIDFYSNTSISIVKANPTFDVKSFKRSVDSITKEELLRVLHLTQQQASTILGCSVSTIKRRFYGLRNELGLTKWPNNYFEYSHLKLFNDIYPLSLNFILNKE